MILWTGIATIGWIIFAIGVSAEFKSTFQLTLNQQLIIINIGRFLQGGAFGAMRVSFNAFCVKWFGKKHIAMSMGVLRSAHNVAHVLGCMFHYFVLNFIQSLLSN